MARFLDYFSPFWGPGAISMVHEPQGALKCRSSTLTVLADSGPIHGPLLRVLADSGPFRGLLLTVLGSQSDYRFGVPERFPLVTIPRVHLCVGHQHSYFWPMLTRFVD